jgi:hypothetical protein
LKIQIEKIVGIELKERETVLEILGKGELERVLNMRKER